MADHHTFYHLLQRRNITFYQKGGQGEEISLFSSLKMLKMSHITFLFKKPKMSPMVKGLKDSLGM